MWMGVKKPLEFQIVAVEIVEIARAFVMLSKEIVRKSEVMQTCLGRLKWACPWSKVVSG